MKSTSAFRITVLLSSLLLFLLTACTKEPGKGGLATITGKVYAYNQKKGTTLLIDSGYYPGQRVFISYGNSTTADDDTRSGWDGTYKFEWLQKGDYTVWTISECDSCQLEIHTDRIDVNISEAKETVTVRDLKIVY